MPNMNKDEKTSVEMMFYAMAMDLRSKVVISSQTPLAISSAVTALLEFKGKELAQMEKDIIFFYVWASFPAWSDEDLLRVATQLLTKLSFNMET